MLPDRRGNNRVDSLRNIVRDPRVSLMFLIPGSGNAVRANGRAYLSVDPELLASFKVEGKAPRSVTVMNVDEIYFQCAAPSSAPTSGILTSVSIRRRCRRPARSSPR
ncbi:putative pyridoxine 5'-phosphate oxidase superfamily flavin-nucleotide-binding protein [Bradyrhizobium japonicum]